MKKEILKLKGVKVHFPVKAGIFNQTIGHVLAVDGVDLDIFRGEVLGLAGESGCGKSVGAMSIMQLIPNPPGRIVNGEVLFQGKDLTQLSDAEMREIRGNKIA